ncbi:DNA polymerase epsilon subunit C [Spathaspora sp. JA1]|nr:DNA polymerase epsilon subunit C [Spathaspora sp. JA1]
MSNLLSLINHDDDDNSYNYSKIENTATPGTTTTTNSNTATTTPENVVVAPGATEDVVPETVSQEKILESFEKIKTHFPAARIKKIMQSDEDIGKVAQATPVIIGRALEIFMANLVEVSILEAKKQGVKRISASHVRSAIQNTEQFDFLVEAVEKYPPLKKLD